MAVRISGHSWLQLQCYYCGNWFHPSPRLGKRQKTCGKDSCRKAHRARYRRVYRIQNPKEEREIQEKRKKDRPVDFWKQYRSTHPIYTSRNRANSKLRKRLAKVGLQRQLDIVQLIDPPAKLELVVGFATSHRYLLEQCLGKAAA